MSDERATIGGEPLKITVPLAVPIKHGDEILTELVLTEPTFEEMEKIGRASANDMGRLTLMAVTGLPPSVIRQLRGRDIKTINDLVPQLLGEDGSPPTGGT
jgi:integrase